jgi:hypothetical protein
VDNQLVLASEVRLLGDEQPDPQWVILGIRAPLGGVAVLASSNLTRAQLRRRWEIVQAKVPRASRPAQLRKETQAVLLEFEGFTYICGDSYGEVMRSLATVWQPPELEP